METIQGELMIINWLKQILYLIFINHNKIDHGKFYDSAIEDANRKKLFAASLDFVERHNSDRSATFQVGLNQFSDMVCNYVSHNIYTSLFPLTESR